MDKYSEENILSFLKDVTGQEEITTRSDIFQELGVVGDDFHEMIENYQKNFNVDMKSYLWYFHADEEGDNSIGGSFFKPPYERVKRIPVTPKMLLDFANSGKWIIACPEHSLPKARHDLTINAILLFGSVILLVLYLLSKYFFN